MKINLFIIVLFVFSLLCGCSNSPFSRKVRLIIPQHPYELYEGRKLWYYLAYNCGGEIVRQYVEPDTRELSVSVGKGDTIYFCAYPLGEMHCYGGVVEPSDNCNLVLLSQNEGFLTDVLLNTDLNISCRLKYRNLLTRLLSVSEDLSLIDYSLLLKDILNGKISSGSIKKTEPVQIESLSFFSGLWVCELESFGRMIIHGEESPEMRFPIGIYRFFNRERNLESKVVVSENGVYKHDRQAAGLI